MNCQALTVPEGSTYARGAWLTRRSRHRLVRIAHEFPSDELATRCRLGSPEDVLPRQPSQRMPSDKSAASKVLRMAATVAVHRGRFTLN